MTIHTSRTIRIARCVALPVVSARIMDRGAVGHTGVHHIPTLPPTSVR